MLLRCQLAFEEHLAGLFAGGGVDVEVAEEDLRGSGSGCAVLRLVVGLDVDGGSHRGLGADESGCLAVGVCSN